MPCDVQGSRHLLSFGYDDHLSSGPEVQEEEREGGTADTPEVPEMWRKKSLRIAYEWAILRKEGELAKKTWKNAAG